MASTHLIDPTGVEPKVWLEKYRTRSGTAGVTVEGVVAYDAVWTWAYALHDLLYTQGVDVVTLTASKAGGTQLRGALLSQDFYGASGRVYFDPATGDRRGLSVKVRREDRRLCRCRCTTSHPVLPAGNTAFPWLCNLSTRMGWERIFLSYT